MSLVRGKWGFHQAPLSIARVVKEILARVLAEFPIKNSRSHLADPEGRVDLTALGSSSKMLLEEKFVKIRSPNLESQQHTRVVLSSIEDTLQEQKTAATPTAYFAALLALLRQLAANSSASDIVISTVYLLDVVLPSVPPQLLRSQFNQISTSISPLITQLAESPPLVKSCIGCLDSLLSVQDAAAWALPQGQLGPRKAIVGLLGLTLENRPKVRKRAQEALANILRHKQPGPALDHPVADLCATFSLQAIMDAVEGSRRRGKQKARDTDGNDPGIIHTLQLAKTIAESSKGWPSKNIEALCEVLLSISKSTKEFLVTSAFEVFEVILESLKDDVSSQRLPKLLEAVVELKPARNDSQLIPPWIAVLSRGYEAFALLNSDDAFLRIPDLFDLVSTFLTSPSHNIRISASECLISFFSNCIPPSVIIEPSIFDEKILLQIAEKASGLLAVRYQSAWTEVFTTLAALFDALRWRGNPCLLPIVQAIGELRSKDSFQGKKEADEVLSHAIRGLGPEAVLSVLPLNLVKPSAGQRGRVWLLPLLRDHVSNTNLAHFKSEMVPLSEFMYHHVLETESREKTTEIKIYETVVHQIWSCLPGYCDLPLDLRMAMDQSFAEVLSNLLYKQSELRVDICRGLQKLVESNQAIVESGLDDEDLILQRRTTKYDAGQNIIHLAILSSNLLAVLFNVYSQTLPQRRAYILQCINTYLSITPEKDLVETFDKVLSMLQSELPAADKPASKPAPSADKLPPTSHTLLDLVIALSAHLPRSAFASLFLLASQILTNPAITSSDPQLVKKAYKLIPRLATSPPGVEALEARNADLQSMILSTADKTPVPARRDRLLALKVLITHLPTTDLHFIPSILSEVVLACKESNERARQAGFDLLVHIANKIIDAGNSSGGAVIKNSKVPHMPDDAPDAVASLEEFFTMVSAGLAGVAPHMVAASIAALSRLLFEFHDQLPQEMVDDLANTTFMFLQSNNREIVRSVLGFVKVAVVALPVIMMRNKMLEIMPGLMVWSKENKGRLRAKVKGILERCIRKFGAADMEKWVGEGDRKMIVNLRKRKERSQRKQKGGAGEEDSEEEGFNKKHDNELDEVLGSDDDSEMSFGEEDYVPSRTGDSGKLKKAQFIRDDEDDEPLDLLGPNALANVSTKKPIRFKDRAVAKRRSEAKTDEDGKLVFGRDNDGDDGDTLMGNGTGGGESAVNAYVDAVDGPDAIRRGQKGRLKVRSGMKKKARAENSGEQMDLDVEEAKEVARSIMQGKTSGGNSKLPQRRGLGVEKTKHTQRGQGQRGRVAKRGQRPGFRHGGFNRGHGGRGGKR